MRPWFRFSLWYNNICPEHGPWDGTFCYSCWRRKLRNRHEREEARQERLSRKQQALWNRWQHKETK
jgi:hypothetical protein